eukprot:11412210-Alexandrium_andersonii.AAC.1
MSTRLGACSGRGLGGGAGASCGARGITCGWPTPADAGSALHTRGAETSPWRASRDHRSPRGR